MKFPLVVLALAAAATAQNIALGYPFAGTSVSRGQNLTVEVDKPNSLSGSTDVSIVIALRSCSSLPDGSCDTVVNSPVPEILGTLLYVGPFSPKYSTTGEYWKPPYENFTAYIPPTFPQGQASLTVTHFVLIGAGPYPILDVVNTTLAIV
ncbi:hypothetical protein BC835DRAFT_1384561 [Cytidiella melzeri]|nr:hypothetical protein BC835DRAFT_1384561 [Cytidiella melzeri]